MEYGLIAERLGHSFSKEVHARLADYEYELKELKTKAELDAFMRARAFKAINVTIPYKEDVIPYLDEIDEVARKIGAVNTVVNRNGRLLGFNTDFAGMKAMCEYAGINMQGKKVLILGSGGTSKTSLAVASFMGAREIYQVSRKKSERAIDYAEAYDLHSDAEIIINTTPCGMYPEICGCAIDLSRFKNLQGAVDAVYNPLKTDFYLAAEKQGARAVCGLYMLVAQAVFASERFLDKCYTEGTAERVYKEILKKKQNIVLVGMPASGKTTIGKILAEELGRPFFDTDLLINEKTGLHPSAIITEQGEKAFRDIEADVIKEVSAFSGAVIATGGGAVLRRENRENLRKNGLIWFVDRPVDLLVTTSDRPLSSTRELLEKRYNERYPIYNGVADFVVNNTKSVDSAVEQIVKEFLK
ncbi:MAG: shikimate dehydrogenase [Clostridia bacterium]|nr:shikimate dehydrogenase [Clostridia bacterium]